MKKNTVMLSVIFSFLGVIPVIIVSVFEDKIVESAGRNTFNIVMTVAVIIVIVASFLPFIKIFKGLFGGKGFNFFWGRGKLAREIIQNGTKAVATIKSIGENSRGGIVTINDQPLLNLVLLIDNNYDPVYEVSIDTIIPRSAVPMYQPGATFHVKVHRKDKMNVVFDAAANQDQVNAASKPSYGGKDWTDQDRLLLEQSGKDAMALLKSIEETGKSENYNPVIKIEYEIFITGAEPYCFSKEIAMPTEVALKMKSVVGKSFKAKIHPEDRTKAVVDIVF